MTLVTPSGYRSFSWSPKADGLTKTASTGAQEKSDKDVLYEAAAKFVKAQAEEKEEKAEKEDKPEKKDDDKGEKSEKSDKGEKSEKKDKKSEKPCDDGKPCDDDKPMDKAPVDVHQAVSDLEEKANKAEEIASKVTDALSKVEEAVQEVKEVAGVTDDGLAGKPEGDVPGVVGDVGGVDEVEVELDVPAGDVNEVEVELPDDVGGGMGGDMPSMGMGNEVVDGLGVEKEGMMNCASDSAEFVKLSSVSKETAKKVTTFWKDYLGYPEDYVKLMVKNYEK